MLDKLKQEIITRIEACKANIDSLRGIDKINGIAKLYKNRIYAYNVVLGIIDELKNDTKSEESCVWEYDGVMFDFSPHADINNILYKIHSNEDFKYCPYCSKKIIVQVIDNEET